VGLYPNHTPVQSIQRIEFAQAHTLGAVRVCPLKYTELKDTRQKEIKLNYAKINNEIKNENENEFNVCKKYFGKDLNSVKVILFGGDYGRDDMYVTPIGVKPGVTLHAYTLFSISERLRSAQGWAVWGKWLAWGFDIILGLGSGFVFHRIWHKFHYYRHLNRFVPQVKWVVLNFIILAGTFIVLLIIVAPLLACGIWINPALIFIGLFIDSYIATATATADGNSQHNAVRDVATIAPPADVDPYIKTPKKRATSPFYVLFGIPDSHATGRDFLLYAALKIAIFWIAVGLAVFILVMDY
jgi:hypothetical protein